MTPRSLSRSALLVSVGLATTSCSVLEDSLFGVYFVKLKAEPAEVVGIVQDIANELAVEPIHIFDSANQGFSVRLPNSGELISEIENLPAVKRVIRDEKVDKLPPDEENDDVVLGENEETTGIERIGGANRPLSLDWSTVHVAVVDTGVDASHPDLNVVGELDVVCMSTPSDCAPGADPQGHGTHVAGTIGARAHGDGVVGVAPGVPIHNIRVLASDGSGYLTDILAGLEYALDNPEVKVVNMSLGGPAGSSLDAEFEAALDALEDAGVVVAIAAGNESQNANNVVPAGLDRGIVVSAYDVSDGGDNGFGWFSNYGAVVDIAAPGVGILSTYPGGDYQALDGTSMAAPHVAGAAALYKELNPGASPQAVIDAIVATGENGYTGQGGDHPEPLLDLAALLDL